MRLEGIVFVVSNGIRQRPVVDNGLGSSVATTPYAEITMSVVDLIRR